eukprot:437709-Pleurochrysis_carterae.AAC.1
MASCVHIVLCLWRRRVGLIDAACGGRMLGGGQLLERVAQWRKGPHVRGKGEQQRVHLRAAIAEDIDMDTDIGGRAGAYWASRGRASSS